MKLFVWDFHGVLEKGNEFAVRKITNEILFTNSFKVKLNKEDCLKLYGVKWFQYFEYILPNENIEKHLFLQAQCFKYSEEHPEVIAKYIKTNTHVKRVVKHIAKTHDQIVISNTKQAHLEMFLKSVKLEQFFLPDKAFGADAHSKYAITRKYHLLENYLKDKKFEEIIYIGDSPEDVDLTKYFKGKTYLYSHKGKKHKDATADFKIFDLREILKEL